MDVPPPQLSEGDAALLTASPTHECQVQAAFRSMASPTTLHSWHNAILRSKALTPPRDSRSVREDQAGCHCVVPLQKTAIMPLKVL